MSANTPGTKNLLTDVEGLTVGAAHDERSQSGVTTVLCAESYCAAVDVRGGAPGTRETDTLALENMVGRVHAVVFSGGSVFGLAAADGVAAVLSARNRGLRLRAESPAIPIVPAAVLHDLGFAGDKHWGTEPPYRSLGMRTIETAAREFELGSLGAGRGARAGLIKGGMGSASLRLDSGLVVGALAVVNCVGSVLMPDGETYWSWPFEIGREFGGKRPSVGSPGAVLAALDPVSEQSRLNELGRLQPGANTTLTLVACNAALTGAECKRVAIMAQDGIARAIRPAHTPFDGDVVFALATAAVPLGEPASRAAHVARLGSAAADCLARAIARAAYEAHQGVSSANAMASVSAASSPRNPPL